MFALFLILKHDIFKYTIVLFIHSQKSLLFVQIQTINNRRCLMCITIVCDR